jgi:ATP-dependent DNA helicase RecG
MEKLSIMDNREWIPKGLLQHKHWYSFRKSLIFIHNPQQILKTFDNIETTNYFNKFSKNNNISIFFNVEKIIEKSIERITFEEVTSYYSVNFSLRDKEDKNFSVQLPGVLFNEFLKHWNLRASQKQAIKDIIEDLSKTRRMFRLIYGDVGSGKTLVAFAGAVISVDNGFQVAIIAPTQILAKQLFEKFSSFMGDKIKISLHCGDIAKKKEKLLFQEHQIIIGTHSVCNLSLERVGMIVFDEQHRFGVKQRESFIQREALAHVMFMSATPIPRSLFMSQNNFMDVSLLAEEGSKVKSYFCSNESLEKLLLKIPQWLEKKAKIFWVCGSVYQFQNIIGCIERANIFKKTVEENMLFLLHGEQDKKEQNRQLSGFIKCSEGILVCTSIIEVGIDIVDANIIVIENSERFGFAQLHQLRGRVGRGSEEGKCIFIFQENEKVLEKITFIANTKEGNKLSEFDMNKAGFGKLGGDSQRGKTNWKFSKIISKDIFHFASLIHNQGFGKKQSPFLRGLFQKKDSSKIMA